MNGQLPVIPAKAGIHNKVILKFYNSFLSKYTPHFELKSFIYRSIFPNKGAKLENVYLQRDPFLLDLLQ